MNLLNTFEIFTDNIRQNITNFKSHFKNVKICAIVKADAYGHGIEGVVKDIERLVDFFGVVDEQEALKVRNVSSKPILILSMINNCSLNEIIKQNISLSASNMPYLKRIEKTAKIENKVAKIHLKINTGMNRLGLYTKQNFIKLVEYINQSNYLTLEGIYTHFYDSTNKERTEVQYQKFCEYLRLIDTKNVIIHASASNACFLDDKYLFDMVRLGNLIYGYLDFIPPFLLHPALKITSTIVNIVNVKKGEGIGYGAKFIAPKNMKVATISLGYADGFLRANSNNGEVIVKNNYAKIVGNICMDLFMIDVTNINCKIGDKVIVLGSNGSKQITATQIANRTNTINYEVLTNFKRDRMNYIIN